ncbi:MAG: peptide chain release factor 1 [Deltaproteobacteria bacterium]|nr:peptide chain release factor 1 [Deltaproteobacteria bacterium]
MFDKLEGIEERLEALDAQLMDPEVTRDTRRLGDISRERRHVGKIVEAWRQYRDLEAQIADNRELLHDDDDDIRQMAKEELGALEESLEKTSDALKLLLLPTDPYEGRPLLIEIRAGTGGDEAALFAGDLFKMYTRFAETRGLKLDVVSTNVVTVGAVGKTAQGYKEIIASIRGDEAYNLFRYEGGVHRVQRVPLTEAQGRIHTSAATVAVLPEPDEVEIKIEAKDLRIDTMRAGGPGGQSVNTTDSAVRIVHIPTGTTVQCQDEKSQLKNKDKAMRVLKARLLEVEQDAKHAEEAAARKAMVGSGDRSERIRTYNYPQNRITDHRINLTLYKLDRVMMGDLDELVDGLATARQAELLKAEGLA